jgi:hypothetical protein
MVSSVCLLPARFCRFAAIVLCFSAASIAQAQRQQAVCTFKPFTMPGTQGFTVSGVNSYGTVVGSAVFANAPSQGFIRYAGGGVKYYVVPNSLFTSFTGRNDKGVLIGTYALIGTVTVKSFILNGSTFTSISFPQRGPRGTVVTGINKWNTVVGYYIDSNQMYHGFKRYSNGSVVTLDYPGAQSTSPAAINDFGTIVGGYSGASSSGSFIYHNGQWATLDFSAESVGEGTSTGAVGISNAGVIAGISSWRFAFTFLYDHGVFKDVDDPAADFGLTVANDMAPNGLLAGSESINSVYNGFTATCN